MFKLKAAVAGLSMVLVCAGFLSLAGCGAGNQADQNAVMLLQKADQQRAQAQNLADLNALQASYDGLANDPGLSPTMRILMRGRQAQFRQERISMMVADLRSQELVIGRDVADIQRLAMEVAGAQSSVDALKSYDPANQIEKLQMRASEIEGSADQLVWNMPSPTAADPNGTVSESTLFAAKQAMETLAARIQQNEADTDAAHKLSAAKGDEAEMYLRRAEGETGDQQVDDTTKSANDRRDAALADDKAATLANGLARIKSNLDRVTDQEAGLEAAVKSINDQIQAQQTRWASISDQIQAQQKVEQALIGDVATSSTMTALATDLAAKLQDAAGLRDKINAELDTVIGQLNGTVMQCQLLRNQWLADVREKQDDPDVIIWKQAEETLHPMSFGLQLATALETKATVAAAKVRIDQLVYHLMNGQEVSVSDAASQFKNLDVTAVKGNAIEIPGITALLDSRKTGMDLPKAFADIQPPELAQSNDEVNKDFQDAVDAFDPQKFGAIDLGPAADQRRNIALTDGAEANRKWAEFDTMVGDTADAQTHTQAAADLEGQIDPSFALTAGAAAAHAPAQAAQ